METTAPGTCPFPAGTRASRLQAWLGLLLAALFLSGCSTTRLAYNQLDRISFWYLKGYFELDRNQERDLRARIDRHLEWHRETQLPRYAAFAADLERDSAGPLSAEYFALRAAELEVFWRDFMEQLTPEAAVFLATLSDDQIEAMFRKIDENHADLERDYAGETGPIRREQRAQAISRSVSRVTGRLTPEQLALIRSYSDRLNDLSIPWLERRRHWQQEFRAALALRDDLEAFEARLHPLLVDPDRDDPPEYRRLVELNQQLIYAMLAELSSELTPRQRDRVQRRIGGFARDFEMLAAASIGTR
ncbi:MAG: hypothetical protein JJT85_06865 [Chromatiales bacterium]|nr:hypothetical protein [Chromatiales bacterium]